MEKDKLHYRSFLPWHWLFKQAKFSWHSTSARHPMTQTNPSQISPLLQSSSLLHNDLQIPEGSQRSLLKQFKSVEQTGVHSPPIQAVPVAQSLFAWQTGPGDLKQATFAVGFGMKPAGHEQVARWLNTVHLAFGPQGVASQGLMHLFVMQASFALQSSSARQPNAHMLCRQMWPKKQSLSSLQVRRQFPWTHFSLKAHSLSLVQIGRHTLSRQVLPSLQSVVSLQDTGTGKGEYYKIVSLTTFSLRRSLF